MNPFTIAFNAVVPIFLMIALGYVARRLGIIGSEFVGHASRWVFRISLPALIFSKVAAIDVSQNFDSSKIGLMIFCGFSIVISYFLSKIAGKLFLKEVYNERGYALGAFIQGSFRSNYLIVGYPILFNLYGDEIVLNAALLTLVVIPFANILAIVSLTDSNESRGLGQYKEIMVKVIKNPLIIAIGLAFLSMTMGIEYSRDYPVILSKFIDMVASVATPLGLIAIGAFFHFEGFKDSLKPTILATIIKLIVIPAVIVVMALIVGISPINMITVAVFLGGPAAISSFAMSNELGGDSRLAGNIVILSSALCVLTYIAMITIILNL